MSQNRIDDDYSGYDYDPEEYDEEEDEEGIHAELISTKRGTSPVKRGTSKMKGNMQDMIDLCEKREHEIRKLKLEIRKLKTQGCTTKAKMREEFQWDGDDAISVSYTHLTLPTKA